MLFGEHCPTYQTYRNNLFYLIIISMFVLFTNTINNTYIVL